LFIQTQAEDELSVAIDAYESTLNIIPSIDIYSDPNFTAGSSTIGYDIENSFYTNHYLYTENAYPRVYSLPDGFNYINAFGVSATVTKASCYSGAVIVLESDLNVTYDSLQGADKYFMGQIVENVDISRYGGYSYYNRSNTTYVNFSDYTPINSNSAYCKEGDVFTNLFDIVRAYYNKRPSSSGYQQRCYVTTQSQIDTRFRLDDINQGYSKVTDFNSLNDIQNSAPIQETVQIGITLFPENYDETIGDLYRYNNVYSQGGNANIGFEKPLNWTESDVNPHKVISSNKKTNGELNDSWLNFLSANFIEVNSEYGEITNLVLFKNKLLFFQPDAFGTLSVNDRSLIQDNNIGSISLGTGGVLTRYDYVSYYSGASLPTDIIRAKNDVFYIDSNARQIMSVNKPDDSISNLSGVDSILNEYINDTNLRILGYDNQFGEVLYTLGDYTVVYNETTKTFTSRYLISPHIYVSTPNILFSQKIDLSENTSTLLYRHNIGDKGLWYKDLNNNLTTTSSVTLITNPNSNMVNIFDNLDLRTEVFDSGKDYMNSKDTVFETASRVKFSNSYLHDVYVESAPDGDFNDPNSAGFKRHARAWKVQVPLYKVENNSYRFVDTHILMRIEFDNNQDKLFKLHDVTSIFRPYNI
jgi:hypothetical protein